MKRLEVLWHARERSPTLVFLHEGLGSATQWRDFPSKLADAAAMSALVYSRAGYGASESIELPRPLDYMEREGEEVLPELLDREGVHDAILVGHSDGASIAIVHAGTPRARGRVRALVLEAPHVFCEDVSVASIAQAKIAYETGDLRDRLKKWHSDVDAAFWGWSRAWLDPRFRAWNIERYLPAIDVPVLVIQGADDPYGTLAQVDAIERGARDVRRVILPGCRHAPHKEKPEETLRAMRDFLPR